MDYAVLRREGIRQRERMAGQLWTDFNVQDPGITILEQFCYAITDLAYRINYDLPDLLAERGQDPYESLFSPAQILTSHRECEFGEAGWLDFHHSCFNGTHTVASSFPNS